MYQLEIELSKVPLSSLVEMNQILEQQARSKSIYDSILSF
jgi:hypothetical protein